jgi:hypothetical protein
LLVDVRLQTKFVSTIRTLVVRCTSLWNACKVVEYWSEDNLGTLCQLCDHSKDYAARIGEIWKIFWINGTSFSSFCSNTFTPDFDYLVLPFNNLHSFGNCFGNKQLHFLSVACERGAIRQQIMSGKVQRKKGESALSFWLLWFLQIEKGSISLVFLPHKDASISPMMTPPQVWGQLIELYSNVSLVLYMYLGMYMNIVLALCSFAIIFGRPYE